MSIRTNQTLKINYVNYKINHFQSKISKKESFCCSSCPNLIHEINSDLKKLLIYTKKNFRKKRIVTFKKNLKSTQKRWAALSSKIVEEIPDRCMQNVLTHPIRALKKIGQCLPNLSVIGVGAYYSLSFRMGCLAWMAEMVPRAFIHRILKTLKIPTEMPSKNSEYAKSIKKLGIIDVGLLGPIIEELMFRYIGQTIVGLVPSSVVFGLAHAFNPHEGAITQAVLTTFSGLLYGYLVANYGIEAPVAAHILNNTLCYLFMKLFSLEE